DPDGRFRRTFEPHIRIFYKKVNVEFAAPGEFAHIHLVGHRGLHPRHTARGADDFYFGRRNFTPFHLVRILPVPFDPDFHWHLPLLARLEVKPHPGRDRTHHMHAARQFHRAIADRISVLSRRRVRHIQHHGRPHALAHTAQLTGRSAQFEHHFADRLRAE